MERAPFAWEQRTDSDGGERPTTAADRHAMPERHATPERPAYKDLPLNFERSHASYQEADPGYVDDTPRMGRAGRAMYVVFLVALAFAGVWVIQRDVEGPVAKEDASQASNKLPSAGSVTPPSLDLGHGTPAQEIDDLTAPTVASDPLAAPNDDASQAPPLPGIDTGGSQDPPLKDDDAGGSLNPPLPAATRRTRPEQSRAQTRRTSEPPPLEGRTVDAGAQMQRATATPPVRQPLVIAPPSRPPYRPTFGDPAPSPPGTATTEPTPSRTPPPPLTGVETAPAPPRIAVTGVIPQPLPRVAVEEPALRVPATPPPPAAAALPPAAAPARPPALTAAPPAAATPATPSRAAAADVESGAIRDVLGRYRNAFNALDAKAARQVWPSVNERTLDRAFEQLEEQSVSFDKCAIDVKGVLAQASCNGTARFVPRVGSRSAQVESRQWSFSLRKAYSGGWLIQEVQAR